MRSRSGTVRLVLAVILLSLAPRPADARNGLAAHVEGGLGPTIVQPLEVEGALGLTACAGVSTAIAGSFRAGLEFAATAGGGPPGAVIPEASQPGDRTLTSFLLGVEAAGRRDGLGPFGFVGAGVGHSTLSHALGVFAPPYDRWLIPSRNVTAFAIGMGTGYRFAGGPGPFSFQLGFRGHAIVDAGRVPASAYAFTVGLAY